jgi:hypothetical protein
VLPFAFDPANPYHWWAAWHVGEGWLRSCRIGRTRVDSRWTFAAQLVLDGSPLQRYQVGEGLVGLDIGPSPRAATGPAAAPAASSPIGTSSLVIWFVT